VVVVALAPAVADFIFVAHFSFFFFHFPSSIGLSFGQMQPDEGWWGKKRVASRAFKYCSRNAAYLSWTFIMI